MDVNEVPTVSVDILLLVTQKLTRQIAAVFRLYMSCSTAAGRAAGHALVSGVVPGGPAVIINLQTVAIPSTLKMDEGDPWPNEHKKIFSQLFGYCGYLTSLHRNDLQTVHGAECIYANLLSRHFWFTLL